MVVAAALAACVESTGPPRAQPPPEDATVANGQLHHLQWRERFPLAFLVADGDGSWELAPSLTASSASADLERYEASVWAVFGEERGLRIDYLPEADVAARFLEFTIPALGLAQYPDGRPFTFGDSVLITVHVDTVALVVRFEPTGLQFNAAAPAGLQIWYTAADQDMDGDGDVDAEDARIERDDLGVWYQEFVEDPWQVVPATHSVDTKWFAVELSHFSGYAVSY